jgi:hypothetical protein
MSSYTPFNASVYFAALAGAASGMGASGRQPFDPNPADVQSTVVANVAGAWAQAFDTAWGAVVPSDVALEMIETESEGVWEGRQPGAFGPNVNPSNFTPLIDALIAIIDAAEAYAISQGIPLTFSASLPAAPGTPAYNPTWYALSQIFVDPANGLDSNSGSSAGQSVKTMTEVVRRYGSSSPLLVYGQSLTIHQLSAQPPNVDAFEFNPVSSGVGAFFWIATPSLLGATFSPASVTAKVQTAGGNDLILNTVPAYVVAGSLVHNVTRDSWAFVASVAGGNATMAQPVPTTGLQTLGYTEDNGWAHTDTYAAFACLGCNWLNPQPANGDSFASAPALGYAWGVALPELNGFSATVIAPIGGFFSFVNSSFACEVVGYTAYDFGSFANCYFGDTLSTGGYTFGGVMNGTLVAGTGVVLDGDLIATQGMQAIANCVLGAVHLEGTTLTNYQSTIEIADQGSGAIVWGGGLLNVRLGSAVQCPVGFTNALKLATLQLDGVGTGSSFNAGAADNPYTAGITITSAHIDTGGGAGNPGLQNPRTGSRYAST